MLVYCRVSVVSHLLIIAHMYLSVLDQFITTSELLLPFVTMILWKTQVMIVVYAPPR